MVPSFRLRLRQAQSRWQRIAAAGLVVAICAGCATPSQRFAERAAEAGLAVETLAGQGFDHLLVRKPGRGPGPLHVYIEGDGRPWLTDTLPADDPTPRRALAFELMLRDPAPAVYLGRPCYFGLDHARCETRHWTDARYGDAIVDSMAAALRSIQAGRADRRLRLIGYSGGGVIATLLARRVAEVVDVVTVAANLDVGAWARLHRYTPLSASRDPRSLPPASIREIHLVGGNDANVPPALVRGYAGGRPNVALLEQPGFDHSCCWVDAWPTLLQRLPPLQK